MNALTKTESTALTPTRAPQFDLSPQTFEQALTFSEYLANSDMVPKDFKGKPGNCLVAIQWGMEIGLKPMQAMQNIAVINGRPSLWGDAVIALARNFPLCEYIIEEDDGRTATCKVKRRGEAEQIRTFSMDDAKTAGLLGKQGPWTQYPKRMRQMRARAFAIRDVFPDALKGLPIAEEVMDMPRDMGQAEEVKSNAPAALLDAARAAAEKGVAAYQEFWKAAGAEGRKALAGEHPKLKQRAIDADRARTTEAGAIDPADSPETGATTGEVTLDAVLAKINAAKNEDALHVAGDWANALTDDADKKVAGDRYDARLAEMRGEQ